MSLEAQTQMFAAPELVGDAWRGFSSRLSNSSESGKRAGTFPDIDPTADACRLHGAIWASVERQWATGECDRACRARQVVRFCLRGLGVMSADGR